MQTGAPFAATSHKPRAPSLPCELWLQIYKHISHEDDASLYALRQLSRRHAACVDVVHPQILQRAASKLARRYIAGAPSPPLPLLLESLPRTTVLNLADARHGGQLPSLQRVKRSNALLATLPQLTTLDVSHNNWRGELMAQLQVQHLAALQFLNLSDNNLTPLYSGKKPVMTCLPQLAGTALQQLHLSRCSLGDAGAMSLPLEQVPQLRLLDLNDNGLQARGAAALRLVDVPLLQELSLYRNAIGAKGAQRLQLHGCTNLLFLDLYDNAIGESGAAALGLQHLPHLQTLLLGHNNLGDGGAAGLQLQNLTALRRLDLRANSIGDLGFGALQLQNLVQLEVLNLQFNPVGVRGLQALALHGLVNLRRLYLDDFSHNVPFRRAIQTRLVQAGLRPGIALFV